MGQFEMRSLSYRSRCVACNDRSSVFDPERIYII